MPATRRTERKKRRTRTVSLEVEIGIVGVDSNFDEATKPVFEFRKNKLYPKLRQNGFKLTLLDGNMATRMFVSKELKLPHIEFFTGSGHGQFNQFTGNFFDPILEVGNYSSVEVSDKIIHLLSCKTAFELGEDVVKNGCKAFFGYDTDFAFPPNHTDAFLECDSEIDIAISEGATAHQAYQRAINLYNEHIERFDQMGLDLVVAVLQQNKEHLCAPDRDIRWGDPQARL